MLDSSPDGNVLHIEVLLVPAHADDGVGLDLALQVGQELICPDFIVASTATDSLGPKTSFFPCLDAPHSADGNPEDVLDPLFGHICTQQI